MPVHSDPTPLSVAQAIEQFVSQYAVPHTQATYRTALNNFADVCGTTTARALTPDDALGWLKALKLSTNTRNLYLVAVRGFYDYLLRHQVIQLDGAALANFEFALGKLRHKAERLPKDVPAEVVVALLAACQAEPAPAKPTPAADARRELIILRNVAIIHTLASSALRAGSLCRLTRGDIDLNKRSGQVVVKRDKQMKFFLSPEAVAAIRAYLRARHDGETSRDLETLPLFCQHHHSLQPATPRQPISPRRLDQIFQSLCTRAQLDAMVVPHQFRHTAAMQLYQATGDLAAVQALLGHENIATTTIYARADSTRLQKLHRQVWG